MNYRRWSLKLTAILLAVVLAVTSAGVVFAAESQITEAVNLIEEIPDQEENSVNDPVLGETETEEVTGADTEGQMESEDVTEPETGIAVDITDESGQEKDLSEPKTEEEMTEDDPETSVYEETDIVVSEEPESPEEEEGTVVTEEPESTTETEEETDIVVTEEPESTAEEEPESTTEEETKQEAAEDTETVIAVYEESEQTTEEETQTEEEKVEEVVEIVEEEPVLFADAQAEPFAYSGNSVTFINAEGGAFGMFTAKEGTEAVLDGDNVVITYYPKNTTVYAGFYFGDIRYEDTRTNYQAAAADGSYSITLSKDYCGKAWPVVPVKKSDGNTTSTQYYLAIPSADKLPEKEEEREEAEPFAYSGENVTFINAEGGAFGMFTAQEGTEAVLDGDNVVITYYPKNTTVYAGFYFGDIRYEDTRTNYQAAAADGSYSITLSKDYCGKAWPVVPVKKSDGNTTSSQYYLAIPSEDKLQEERDEAEPFDYSGDSVTFINAEGRAFGMFTAQEGTEAVLDGDNVVITYYPKNTTVYAGFYFGDIRYEDTRTNYQAAAGDGSYSITLSKDYCGKAWPVVPVKKSDGNTTSTQYYLAIPAEDKLQEERDEAEPFTYDGDSVTFINAEGGAFGMFTAQEGTEAVLDGDNVVITYYPKNTTVYAGFYFGDIRYEDTRTDYQAAAADGSYSITLSKDYCGKAWPVVPVKKSDGNTTSTQYYLAIPSEDKLQEERDEAEPFTYDGDSVTFINAEGGAFGMFTAQEGTEAVLDGDNVVITYYPKSTTVYAGFYFGDIRYEDTRENYQAAAADGSYSITLSKDYCGKAWPVVPVKNSDGATTSTQYYLAIPSADKLPDKEEERDEAEPFTYDGDSVSFINAEGGAFGMFTAQEGTEAVLDGDNVVITYYPKNTTVYAGFYFGDIRYEDTRENYQAAVEDGSYSITLSKDYCGKAWPVVPVKKSDGNTTSSQYYLAIPSEDKLQEEEEEEITDAKSYEVAVSSSGGSMYAAAEGINAYIAQQEDGTLAAKITTVNGKADMAAIGSRDEIIEHAVDWYKNEGDKDHSVFTIPIDSMNCSVTLYFRNATTGNWSSAGYTYTFSAETLKKASEEAVELGENVDPCEKEDETGDDDGKNDDPSDDPSKDPSEDPEKKDDQDPGQTDDQTPGKEDQDSDQQSAKTPLMILKSDGTEYGMLRVTEYSAVSDGENITITFFTTHETYALKLYLGTVDEISSISKAYTRAEDTSFTITVPYADKGSKLPLVIATSKGWKNEQYYIQIPDVVTETDEPVEEAPQEDDEDNTSYQPEETGDTNGTTAAVNNQTALADGVYTPDSFSFSGGTGKLTISCTQISVRNGKAYATLVFSSGNIIYVKASGGTYYPIAQTGSSSTYEIPVELNSNNQILACTTAMSQPHEVAYTIFIGLNAAKNVQDRKDGEEIKTEDGTALIFRTNAPEVPGLTYIGTLKTESAQFFRLHYYEDGFKVLQISLSDERPDWDMIAADLKNNSLREDTNTEEQAEEKSLYNTEVLQYLLMPADAEVPAGAEKEMIICVVPAEHAYIASKAVLEQLDEEELKAVAAVADADVINETLAQALEAGELKTAGTIENVDYKTLLLGGVDLAVVALKDLAATADENTEKQISDPGQALREQIVSCGDDMQLLEIALLIDRSEEETEEKGREEWNAVYHAFLRKQSDQ